MERVYIILIACIIGALLLVFVLLPATSKSLKSKTTVPSNSLSSNNVNQSGPTSSSLTTVLAEHTTSIPAKVQITAFNIQYVYSGPTSKNGVTCYYKSYTYIDGGDARIVNGSQKFYMTFQPSSSQCPVQISSITIQTPGFSIASTVPSLPVTFPPYSQVQIIVGVTPPSTSFYGPATMTVNYQ